MKLKFQGLKFAPKKEFRSYATGLGWSVHGMGKCVFTPLSYNVFLLLFFCVHFPCTRIAKECVCFRFLNISTELFFNTNSIAVNSCCYIAMQNDFGQRQSFMPEP